MFHWFFVLLIIFLCSIIDGEKNATIRPENVLPEHYVKEIRPPAASKGSAVMVDFNIYVVDINSINVEDMDFRVDMIVIQQWEEPRLRLPDDIFEEGDDYVTLPPEFFDNLWQPDPYFINTKIAEIASLTHKFSSVTLFKNKTVRYTARMYAIIACQMEFLNYPMDVQNCPLYIESFSYNNKKVHLQWANPGVTLNHELKLLQYHVGEPMELKESTEYICEKGGNFSRLTVYFRFERQIGHHLIQTFAPSALVVVLSWFSFWIGLDAIPGRVTLIVTSMLTLVTMFTGLRSDIPPVAYIKALDIWMAGCMLFVFASLGEFIVVKVLEMAHNVEKKQNIHSSQTISLIQNSNKTTSMETWDNISLRLCNMKQEENKVLNLQSSKDPKMVWEEIDKISRIIFPILFLLFMTLYWPILLLRVS